MHNAHAHILINTLGPRLPFHRGDAHTNTRTHGTHAFTTQSQPTICQRERRYVCTDPIIHINIIHIVISSSVSIMKTPACQVTSSKFAGGQNS